MVIFLFVLRLFRRFFSSSRTPASLNVFSLLTVHRAIVALFASKRALSYTHFVDLVALASLFTVIGACNDSNARYMILRGAHAKVAYRIWSERMRSCARVVNEVKCTGRGRGSIVGPHNCARGMQRTIASCTMRASHCD